MTEVEYVSILPRDLQAGMIARFYVATQGIWGSEMDCEVLKASKVKRPEGTRYAVTIAHTSLPNGRSTRYITPQQRVTIKVSR